MNPTVRKRSRRLPLCAALTLLFAITADAQQNTPDRNDDRCEHLRQFTFSWQFIDQCGMQPRGGTSRGAELTLDPEPHEGWKALQKSGLNDFERDRQAILAMAGPYRTTFDFLEVVGFQNDFEPAAPYQSWGTEYVYVVEDRGDFISLQHIMVMVYEDERGNMSEPMVMKHWRQDWAYEKQNLLVYTGNGRFENKTLSPQQVAGAWAQSVYQVDDSPRYQSIGRWEHLPNFSTWTSEETWRPLPRRESSVRDDYDVLIGTNTHTIIPHGWVHEQANYKTVLHEAGEVTDQAPYLSKELGVNRYRHIVEFDFEPGDRYWERTGVFWEDVREEWDRLIENNESFVLHESVDGEPLFSPLFSYAQKVYEEGDYDAQAGQRFVQETLGKYTQTASEEK
jgi:hypothetical protein